MTEDSYDAYEEDIAVAHFYFQEPTVFEYTRYVKGYPLSLSNENQSLLNL